MHKFKWSFDIYSNWILADLLKFSKNGSSQVFVVASIFRKRGQNLRYCEYFENSEYSETSKYSSYYENYNYSEHCEYLDAKSKSCQSSSDRNNSTLLLPLMDTSTSNSMSNTFDHGLPCLVENCLAYRFGWQGVRWGSHGHPWDLTYFTRHKCHENLINLV